MENLDWYTISNIHTSVYTSILEVCGSIALSHSLDPITCVVDPMIFVIVKVVNGSLTVRNCRAREQSPPTDRAFIQARVQLIFVIKYLQNIIVCEAQF